ncbi:hypothetical protein FA743_17460 [Paracoccus gahaiensis]|uniref:Aminoglycoside phosphotransferase domain-containing protein n=1 Tax=Paracoccus gahaiensis TaxID=1706839 RepID=A0A4U0R6G7_9RHOB|nr:aminoglycoside phosphotransferase family protein [Paracoccus gahaiensis]TJZ89872.1 hypothetical protein FA743_17460 [Paracoccus gahaiensis]
MLSPADLRLCSRDPALPGLPLLLDAAAMAQALGCAALTPAYLRYKPGVSCTASFLTAEGQALAVHAYPADRYDEESRRPRWRRDPAVIRLPQHGAIAIPARLDRHLRGLDRLLDPDKGPRHLRRMARARLDLASCRMVLLRYKPGRRLVARIDLDGQPWAVLKVMGEADFDRALIGATAAMAQGQAPLLGADSRLRAILTAWIPGRPVCPEMTGHAPDPAVVAQIGAALAALHGDPFRPAADWSAEGDAEAVLTAAADLGALDPDLGARAGGLAADLAARLGRARVTPGLVHGDFSADQVVMAGDRPVILDWDNAGCGDPARDLGSFLARLDAQVADALLTQPQADNLGAALLQGYGAAPGTLPLHHARALLLLAGEGFRLRRGDWPARGRALLERVEAILHRPGAIPTDPDMPQLAAALDPVRVLPALRRASGLQMAEGAPALLRHKPGRRALIRYPLAGADGAALLGKLRAKGPDRRMPALHAALRRAGLDGRAPHRTGIPRARGAVDALNMWLQDEVPGGPLDPGDTAAMARSGAALARLHAVPAVTDRRWSHADEGAVLDHALSQAASGMPDQAGALQAIRGAAQAALAALPPGPDCGIHRDFYVDQVLIDGDRVWLVDLDLYAIGDPGIDLGNFLAHLDELALRRTGDATALKAAGQAFLRGYASIRPLPEAHRIRVFRHLSLARHIWISTRFADRRHSTQALIELSLKALADADPPALLTP